MKTRPAYTGNILTKDLQALPNGTLFSEHHMDELEDEAVIWKKMRNCPPNKKCPLGDIVAQPMTCGQFSEVPGEECRIGLPHDDQREWRVWNRDNVERMVGFMMASHQYFND